MIQAPDTLRGLFHAPRLRHLSDRPTGTIGGRGPTFLP